MGHRSAVTQFLHMMSPFSARSMRYTSGMAVKNREAGFALVLTLVVILALSLLTEQTHVLIGPLLVVVALFGRRGLAGAFTPKAIGGAA